MILVCKHLRLRLRENLAMQFTLISSVPAQYNDSDFVFLIIL